MKLHDEKYNSINPDCYLSADDCDRKGIELCLEGINNICCNPCSFNLVVFDAFFDYFLENLQLRKIPRELIAAYRHLHNGQRAAHCLYNDLPEKAKARFTLPREL